VRLPNKDTNLHNRQLVLRPESFDAAEWRTLSVLNYAKTLNYSFGIDIPSGVVKDCFTEVVDGLLQTGSEQGQPWLLKNDALSNAGLFTTLQFLRGHNLVTQMTYSTECSTWALTNKGTQSLQMVDTMVDERRVFQIRPDKSLLEQHSFELILQLEQQGWECLVHRKGVRRPLAYEINDKKTYWIKSFQKSMDHLYMLCLLSADQHQRAVAHFAPQLYYVAILEGKDYNPKKKGVQPAHGSLTMCLNPANFRKQEEYD
jgi:hypothetical protein